MKNGQCVKCISKHKSVLMLVLEGRGGNHQDQHYSVNRMKIPPHKPLPYAPKLKSLL